MLKVAASQLPSPKIPEDLLFSEIDEIMNTNFDFKRFIACERYKFFTEIKREPDETPAQLAIRIRQKASTCDFQSIVDQLDEMMKTCFISTINNGAVIKAIFHRSNANLSFLQTVEIATEVEEASKSAKAQILDDSELDKVSIKASEYQCKSCGK
ncbi:hypothetical protein RF11_15167 [Thelohanellus kitauei]|uniref:Uncharacterized protein n=1 Tax=Thelohanellus kitauei TaxID=669202 RepID=A0A0C2J4C4_THEKT|nr:hypothetical protein RF11_15167 [Thelohanellus kitauei]